MMRSLAMLRRRVTRSVCTRDCNPTTGYGWPQDMDKFINGHAPHAYTHWGRAYRCRGSKPIDMPLTIDERQLAELRRIRELLEVRT